jgi:hypothetical protein
MEASAFILHYTVNDSRLKSLSLLKALTHLKILKIFLALAPFRDQGQAMGNKWQFFYKKIQNYIQCRLVKPARALHFPEGSIAR